MGNKWRNDDFNRWDEEDIRRSRAASGRDEARQYSQDVSGSSQYGNESDYRSERDSQRNVRDRLRRAAPDMERQYENESFALPGTFYYGGQPQRQFGLGPGESGFESDNAPDAYSRNAGRSSPYGYSGGNSDSAFRQVAAYERETSYAHDHPNRDRQDYAARGGRRDGLFNDDPNKGPIDRVRNWMSNSGKGPKGYKRSDERIRDDINDHLTHDHSVDATHIDVAVADCECTLSGNVATRDEKRRAEDIAERIMGVKHVQNNLRVSPPTASSALSTQDRTGTMSTSLGSNPTLSASCGSSNS